MKKIFLLAIATITLFACNKNKGDANANLHITGDIKGLSQGKLYLQRIQDSTLVILDSISINGDSKFESHLQLESPEMLYLFLDRGVSNSLDNNVMFFAEPGKINIETSLDSYISDAKITGSKNNDLYEEYQKVNIRFRDENLSLIEQKFKAIKSNSREKRNRH